MKSKLSGREKLLVGVLAVSLAALWYGVHNSAESRAIAVDTDYGGSAELGEPPMVLLELLGMKTATFDPRGRNLFAYHQPRQTSRAIEKTPGLPIVVEPSPPMIPGPTPPPEPARHEPGFNYIGCLGPEDALIAVFESGAEIFLAQTGDIVGETFELLNLGCDSAVLRHLGDPFPGEIVNLEKGRS